MSRKRIALITTYFPPRKSVASNRMLAFAEYLSEKFELTVFCMNDELDSNQLNYNVICTPESNLHKKLEDKTEDGKLLHFFKVGTRLLLSKFLKNPLANWKNETGEKLRNRHADSPFDCVISSYAPAEAHEVAIPFIKEFSNVKWVADMRDEMSKNPFINADEKVRLQGVERQINELADGLLTVSEPILKDFEMLCPDVKKTLEVRNGFNHSFINKKDKSDDGIFRIGYFGTFYGEQKPNHYFAALEKVVQEIEFKNFEIHFFGVHQNFSTPEAFKSFVHVHANKPYLEAIENMGNMDLNLLLLPVSERRGVFSGKLFDYVSVQRPILACVDKTDVAADLINEMRAGYVSDFSNEEEIKQNIIEAVQNWNKGDIFKATEEQVASLHRKRQVSKLSSLIKDILAS